MKAIIFHGTALTPKSFWYAWLGDKLSERGYKVEIPYYPDLNREPIGTFIAKVMKDIKFDPDTVLIGHSAGCALILSILERIQFVAPQAILVAEYSKPLPGDQLDVILQDNYNWAKIKSHIKDIVFINSVNDPWGCDDKQGRLMFDQLGGTQLVMNEGHFGSESKNQPYPTFDLLNRIVI